MKSLIPILALVLIFSTISYSQGFEGLDFGSSRDDILNNNPDVEWVRLSDKPSEVDTISFRKSLYERDTEVEFVLIRNELVAGSYHFGEEENMANQATFDEIYPHFSKEYGEPDNLHKKKKFQRAIWYIAGEPEYYIEITGGHGMVKVHYDWHEKIEAYNKEAKKANRTINKRK